MITSAGKEEHRIVGRIYIDSGLAAVIDPILQFSFVQSKGAADKAARLLVKVIYKRDDA